MLRTTRTVIVTSTALAAMIWFAAPLAAQRGHDGKQSGRTQPQAGTQRAGQAPQRSAPQTQARPQAPAPQQQAPQQRAAQVQRPAPPPSANYERAQTPRQAPPRPANVARVGPPARDAYRPQGSYPATRGYYPQATPYSSYGRSTHDVRRPVFVQPYYAFRPRFSVGFGIQVGYGVAYPFNYYDPYGFYNFRIGVVPGYGPAYRGYGSPYDRIGGLSFEIDPYDAAVFIDGEYVGVAADFSSGQMPLTLAAGRHRVDLRAQGFMAVSFDITVVAGQVIPYAGTMPYVR
jgi:hypothetical protein